MKMSENIFDVYYHTLYCIFDVLYLNISMEFIVLTRHVQMSENMME